MNLIQGQGKETGSSASTVSRAPIGTPLVITKTLTNEVTKIIQSGCDKDHMDLFICENYFNNYLFEVSTWAKAHDQALEDHMWKACMLLSLVERVPSACCTKFQNTCTSFLEFISRRM
uniref:SCAPER_N domain-containing protein n=2 Tax=Angiostrongylus cantonensis TaxID=6313 RepID=A0A0K0CWR0_ANGCA